MRFVEGIAMLGPTGAEVVLWLHVIAATVWIGGQVVVAAVVPLVRPHPGLGAALGRRYQAVAWPAFGVLVLTGVANLRHVGIGGGDLLGTQVGRTMSLKLGLVLLSGAAAAVHALVQAPRASRTAAPSAATSAVLGSVSVLAAAGAALLGVVVHGA